MMVQKYKHQFILLLILNLVTKSNTLFSSLKHSINKVVETSDAEIIKGVLNGLPIETFPKFTKQDLPQSAIDALRSGEEDEDRNLNIIELVKKNGFKVETHHVQTCDGYILHMIRIPGDGTPVLLMHGVLSSSNDWCTNGRYSSLPYLLGDRGYDVWMGDARGNHNSRQHISLDPVKDKKQFWDFSWDEIGRYDLPAMIDYVLDTTGQQQLTYVCHSQGCTCFYVLCSEIPEYNEKFSLKIGLSSPVFMKHISGVVFKALAPFAYYKNSPLVTAVGPQMFADDTADAIKTVFCDDATDAVTQLICTSVMFLVLGFNYEQAHYERLPTIMNHMVAGASTKDAVHYAQSVIHEKFRHFDYGQCENERIYGCKTPPEYPLENVRVPVAIFYGKNDRINDIRDVRKLISHLKNSNCTLHEVPNKHFAHLDFLFAKDVKSLLYDDVIRLIEEHFAQQNEKSSIPC